MNSQLSPHIISSPQCKDEICGCLRNDKVGRWLLHAALTSVATYLKLLSLSVSDEWLVLLLSKWTAWFWMMADFCSCPTRMNISHRWIYIYLQCHFNARFSNIVCFVFSLFNIFSLFQIGQFFGEVDPVLMISLVNVSLFSFNKTYDYQSVCDPERETKAAAGPRSVYVVKYTCQH